ncbi:MAG: c-type cytochrome, partial [Acidobacteria bacterium]|nr:c-type cytochrome [Acidobacteriota bacterium]
MKDSRLPVTVAVPVLALLAAAGPAGAQTTNPLPAAAGAAGTATASGQALLDRYCVACHNEPMHERGAVPFAFDALDVADVGADPGAWEAVVRKLRLGMMPPAGRPRPEREAHEGFVAWLEAELDRAAAAAPYPGRPAVRRLTTAEYVNAVRDLLALDIDERWL